MSDDYELPSRPACSDTAEWGAWDLPEWAVAIYCDGCGGLIGVEYE